MEEYCDGLCGKLSCQHYKSDCDKLKWIPLINGLPPHSVSFGKWVNSLTEERRKTVIDKMWTYEPVERATRAKQKRIRTEMGEI